MERIQNKPGNSVLVYLPWIPSLPVPSLAADRVLREMGNVLQGLE